MQSQRDKPCAQYFEFCTFLPETLGTRHDGHRQLERAKSDFTIVKWHIFLQRFFLDAKRSFIIYLAFSDGD
jgi:hypothetical protein